MIEHALRYGALGLRVFPLWWPGNPHENDENDPKIAGAPIVGKWPKLATSDADQIREWWTRFPEAGIGLACGDELSEGRHLLVVDLDRHDENGADGVDEWRELELAHGDVEDGPNVLTPRDGNHVYVTTPEPLSNSRGTLPAGIDVRGRGGYVVLPPSGHRMGGVYEWETELGELTIPEAPSWLLEALKPPEPTAKPEKRAPSEWDTLDDRPGTQWARSTSWA